MYLGTKEKTPVPGQVTPAQGARETEDAVISGHDFLLCQVKEVT